MTEDISKISPEAKLKAAAEMILESLSDDQVATFYNSATWDDGETRSRLQNKPWFSKIESLFTENGGKDLHPTMLEAMAPIVVKRLTPQG
ncbi:hypothetical protein HY030_04010 [Candidatus Gottesmanbacteria bacterium]|nr:hypothetical protein [Candidatus Gottesmanbacteria bacterium]